jgi:hypothetical protein
MKPANFLHLFAIILLTCFAYTEHNNLNANYQQHVYDLRVAKSHTSRFAGKTERGREEVKRLKQEMEDVKAEYVFFSGLTGYKALVILVLFLMALWQFARYFKIDFDDANDIVVNSDYQRKTWLLNFLLFFVIAVWSLYFRQNYVIAVLSYLVAIGSLVRSLMLATELRLISRNTEGSRTFKTVTLVTAVILYFNLLLIGGIYYSSMFAQTSLIEALINIGR